MSHTLVTFLGRTERKDGGYTRARYHFPDGAVREAAFVGFPLARWLGVARLVILGTCGSMWDHLFEAAPGIHGEEDERLQLVEAVDAHRVEQAQLDRLAPLLSAALGCDVTLRLIPVALAADEQVSVLSALSEVTQGERELSLDVTHGYRHLPMLALTAALYLQSLQPELAVRGLWYGAFDPATKESRVSNLAGLLAISDWARAWQRFDWLGDYGAVSPLIEHHDADLAGQLREAAYRESIHQGQQARGLLTKAKQRLQEHPLAGAGALYQPALLRRTDWVRTQRLYQRQREHAIAALHRDDFLRTCLYGFEGFITKLVQTEGRSADENNAEDRQNAKKAFEHDKPPRVWGQYRFLRDLRNVLAHGNRPALADVQTALQSLEALRGAIDKAIRALLPEEAL